MTSIHLPKERRIGHLTLHRQGKMLTVKEYNALSAAERLEMIRQAQGKQKLDLLLNAHDVEKLVPQLHPQELYLTVNQLGPDSSSELLMLANTEQLTTLLDLDCWNGDELSPVLSLHWLDLLLSTGADKICRLAKEIEPELLALFLKKHLNITRGLEAFDDDEVENANRLEGLYDIEYASEDAAKIIGALLTILMQQEQETYLLVMEMIRSEITSVLEEEVYQSRDNRLLDLGILPVAEAKALYSYIDTESFQAGGKEDFNIEADGMQNPGALLAHAVPDNLLGEILATDISHQLATELCLLANRKMSADQTDLASTEAISENLQSLYRTLNLALENLVGNDLGQAEAIFKTSYLQQLYQYGYSLIRKRQLQAQQLVTSPIGKLLDYPEQLFIDSLLQQPAYLYIDATEDSPSVLQEIASNKDLRTVDTRLQQLKALEKLFTGQLPFALPMDEELQPQHLTLTSLLMTAVANQVLGSSLEPVPLPLAALAELCEKTLEAGQISKEFGQGFCAFLHELSPGCDFFAQFCLECWEEELCEYLNPADNFHPSFLIFADESLNSKR